MSKTRDLEFLQKLASLLGEYNAEISIDADENSDLNGVGLVVRRGQYDIFESCFSVDALDLNQYIKYYYEKS